MTDESHIEGWPRKDASWYDDMRQIAAKWIDNSSQYTAALEALEALQVLHQTIDGSMTSTAMGHTKRTNAFMEDYFILEDAIARYTETLPKQTMSSTASPEQSEQETALAISQRRETKLQCLERAIAEAVRFDTRKDKSSRSVKGTLQQGLQRPNESSKEQNADDNAWNFLTKKGKPPGRG